MKLKTLEGGFGHMTEACSLDGIIFQLFTLNEFLLEKEIDCREPEEGGELKERWGIVRREMLERGFTLLCGQKAFCGVPAKVIVGVPAERVMQLSGTDCFHGLALKHDLIFLPGEYFLEDPGLENPQGSGDIIDLPVSSIEN